jgi:5-methylcytosine-specific restriction endonuclease McrA
MRATFDHVVPASHDSNEDKNVLNNIVASCWSCNFGKSYFTVEELGMEFPSEPEFRNGWDGLTTVLGK